MQNRPIYRVKDWAAFYESAETRKLENLRWVPTPNKHDGLGFRRILKQRDRCDLLAAWTLIVQVASKARRLERGVLMRDGRPLTADDLELMTGFPAAVFSRALQFFSDSDQGWLVCEQFRDDPSSTASVALTANGSPVTPAESPEAPADAAGTPATSPAEGKGREGNGIEEKDVGKSAALAAPSSAEELIGQLSANPAYTGIDVAREYSKMESWCSVHKKHPTARRFVNWLNRVEQPLARGSQLEARFDKW